MQVLILMSQFQRTCDVLLDLDLVIFGLNGDARAGASRLGPCLPNRTVNEFGVDLAIPDALDGVEPALCELEHRRRVGAPSSIKLVSPRDCMEARESTDNEKTCEPPDGNIITVGSERFRCPEVLSPPSFIGK